MTRLKSANNARTTLASSITDTVDSFDVGDASQFPSAPFKITIEDEIMEVGTVNTNTFSNVLRGQEGTTASAHSSGAVVENRWTAGTHQELADQAELDAHKAETMPHQLEDLETGKTYRYGYQTSADGKPQLIYEEVI